LLKDKNAVLIPHPSFQKYFVKPAHPASQQLIFFAPTAVRLG